MRCPYCKIGDSEVIDSKPKGNDVRRRRRCLRCNKIFITMERVKDETKGIFEPVHKT